MKNTVIFDLDGTILNTLPDIRRAVNHALESFGLDGISLEETRTFVGSGLKNTILKAIDLKSGGVVISEDAKSRMYMDMMQYYSDHPDVNTVPYDGVAEMMTRLAKRGVKVAVLSNKDDSLVPYLVRHFFPEVPFALVRGHREGLDLKPDPALIDDVLAELGSTKEETIIVGDSGVDYLTGKNAGLDTIIVCYGFRSREELSSCECPVLDTVAELEEEIIRRL